jgi:hypothetical protein
VALIDVFWARGSLNPQGLPNEGLIIASIFATETDKYFSRENQNILLLKGPFSYSQVPTTLPLILLLFRKLSSKLSFRS